MHHPLYRSGVCLNFSPLIPFWSPLSHWSSISTSDPDHWSHCKQLPRSAKLELPPTFLLSTKCGSLPPVFYPILSPTIHWTINSSFILTHPTTTKIFASMPNTLSCPVTQPIQITNKLHATYNRNRSPSFIESHTRHNYHIVLAHTSSSWVWVAIL